MSQPGHKPEPTLRADDVPDPDRARPDLDSLSSSLAHSSLLDPQQLEENTPPGDGPLSDARSSPFLSDDLIPPTDPCYLHRNLRNQTVELLHLVTARTIFEFITSLLDHDTLDVLAVADNEPQEPDSVDIRQVMGEQTRLTVKNHVERNKMGLARHARLETQLLVGQYLLEARESLEDLSKDQDDDDETARLVVSRISNYILEQPPQNITVKSLISVSGNVINWDQLPIDLFSEHHVANHV